MSNQAKFTDPIRKMPQHGLTGTPEYWAWRDIKKRCYNPNNRFYKNYGGRGIKMYKPWITRFVLFYQSVGKRPGKGYSIDRIDNNGDYEPGNVKWSTKIEQDNNRRTNVVIEYNGEKTTISKLSRDKAVNTAMLRYYYYKYDDIYKALDKVDPLLN